MKRFLFYVLVIAAMVATSVVLLVLKGPWGNVTGVDKLDSFVNSITTGNFKFSLNSIMLYGFVIFILMNAAMLITMVLILIITLGRLSKIMRIYRIVIWYLVSAIIFTGTIVYSFIADKLAFSDLHWSLYLPIGTAVLTLVAAIIFRLTERNK